MLSNKEQDIVALDMINGMTYIGEHDDRSDRGLGMWLKDVIVVKTIDNFPYRKQSPLEVSNRLEIYKKDYELAIIELTKEKGELPSMLIDKTKIVAEWYL